MKWCQPWFQPFRTQRFGPECFNKSAWPTVSTLVRSIFEQPDATSTWAQHARVVERLAERFADAAGMLIDAAPDVLAFTAFPKEHWRQIRSNNPQGRLN